MKVLYTFTTTLLMIALPSLLFADGEFNVRQEKTEPVIEERDPRLPPVLPGERVHTRGGQKLRVWSTAGPVPAREAPTLIPNEKHIDVGEVDVIVDTRDDRRDRKRDFDSRKPRPISKVPGVDKIEGSPSDIAGIEAGERGQLRDSKPNLGSILPGSSR